MQNFLQEKDKNEILTPHNNQLNNYISVIVVITYKWLGVSVRAPRRDVTSFAFLSIFSTKSSKAREMITGTAAATFPTSSSLCIIFFILA